VIDESIARYLTEFDRADRQAEVTGVPVSATKVAALSGRIKRTGADPLTVPTPGYRTPMVRIIKFAVATAMRQDEITRIQWEDFNEKDQTVIIRRRKHPRRNETNDQTIPLVADTGYDAMALLAEQAAMLGRKEGIIFPYNPRSIGHPFRGVCRDLQIEGLHFRDLRHEGISRLSKADFGRWRACRAHQRVGEEGQHQARHAGRRHQLSNSRRYRGRT
jgi:integrase